jgi:hypothetical protein
MQSFLSKGLAETHALWTDVEMGYRWVHRAGHLLTNDEKQTASQVRQNYETFLAEIEQAPETSVTLIIMLATFRKVTASYWPGLFHCYDVADLPRTNNDLEQYFGSARYHERRATGRKTASPGIVVRGAVRLVTSVATRLHHFCGADLQPTEIERWYALRNQLDGRQQLRRAQFRFRRDPNAYLAELENKLLLLRLPP